MLYFFCREHRTSRLLACFGLKIQEMFFSIAFSDYKVLSISVSKDVDGGLSPSGQKERRCEETCLNASCRVCFRIGQAPLFER
jgi:hypothetical protein